MSSNSWPREMNSKKCPNWDNFFNKPQSRFRLNFIAAVHRPLLLLHPAPPIFPTPPPIPIPHLPRTPPPLLRPQSCWINKVLHPFLLPSYCVVLHVWFVITTVLWTVGKKERQKLEKIIAGDFLHVWFFDIRSVFVAPFRTAFNEVAKNENLLCTSLAIFIGYFSSALEIPVACSRTPTLSVHTACLSFGGLSYGLVCARHLPSQSSSGLHKPFRRSRHWRRRRPTCYKSSRQWIQAFYSQNSWI